MEDCIFCKIVRGEIPASRIYEDEYVIAFDDVAPQTPVHALVVPIEHHVRMDDDLSVELMGRIFSAVPKVAALKGIAESGFRVVVNNGPDAGQAVAHLHVHVMGGARLSDTIACVAGE